MRAPLSPHGSRVTALEIENEEKSNGPAKIVMDAGAERNAMQHIALIAFLPMARESSGPLEWACWMFPRLFQCETRA